MSALVFTDAEALDQYLQDLNDQGEDASVALVDHLGILWLTYGEEHSGGGEWMTCWLISPVDPWDLQAEEQCPSCGYGRPPEPIPLTDAMYPVRLLSDVAVTS